MNPNLSKLIVKQNNISKIINFIKQTFFWLIIVPLNNIIIVKETHAPSLLYIVLQLHPIFNFHKN